MLPSAVSLNRQETNDNRFFVGGRATWVDFVVWDLLDLHGEPTPTECTLLPTGCHDRQLGIAMRGSKLQNQQSSVGQLAAAGWSVNDRGLRLPWFPSNSYRVRTCCVSCSGYLTSASFICRASPAGRDPGEPADEPGGALARTSQTRAVLRRVST